MFTALTSECSGTSVDFAAITLTTSAAAGLFPHCFKWLMLLSRNYPLASCLLNLDSTVDGTHEHQARKEPNTSGEEEESDGDQEHVAEVHQSGSNAGDT